MSQSSKTTHNFGNIVLASDILADVINVSSAATYSVPQTDSGAFITCAGYTAGTTVVTLPSTAGAEYTVMQKTVGSTAGARFKVTSALPMYGGLTCVSVTGANVAVTGGTTITFTQGSLIGDTVTFKSDGTNYYVTGTFGTIGSLTSTA